MTSILQSLASLYRKSASGRKGASKDFTIDYEKFLRLAGAADGDDRESAELDLAAAAAQSGGCFQIDRDCRTGFPIRLRLIRDGGEAWLFQQTGETTPEEERGKLAIFFRAATQLAVPEPWQQAWNDWLSHLAQRALAGETIQPFRRDDSKGNSDLIHALAGILNWQKTSLIRYASMEICGDSKRLQQLESRLRAALGEITGKPSLEAFGIFQKPRSATFHGPLEITIGTNRTDFSPFPGPVTLSERNLIDAATVTTASPVCLTVENEDTFHELANTNQDVLLILTSFPGSAVVRLIDRLPTNLTFLHFGDSDPAGSDILRDLRAKTGRDIRPLLIDKQPASPPAHIALSPQDRKTIHRLLDSDLPSEVQDHLAQLMRSGVKSGFEQEAVPVEDVWRALAEFLA